MSGLTPYNFNCPLNFTNQFMPVMPIIPMNGLPPSILGSLPEHLLPLSSSNLLEGGYSSDSDQHQTFEGMEYEHSFKLIKPGDLIFFKHTNKLTHVAIKRLQEWSKKGDDFTKHMTHVGVVTEVLDNHQLKIGEIAAFGETLSENQYDLKELFDDEELVFAQALSEAPKLKERITEVAQLWSKQEKKDNQYNLAGLAQILFHKTEFNDEDKEALLNAYIDYLYLERSPHEQGKTKALEPKKFFCSEYSLQIHQLSRLLHFMPSLPQKYKSLIESLDLNLASTRKSLIQTLKHYTEKVGVWKQIAKNFFYQVSSKAVTPSSLMQAAFKDAKIIQVKNPDAEARFKGNILQEKYSEYLEYTLAKVVDDYFENGHFSVNSKHAKNLLDSVEKTHFLSRKTMSCFLDQCLAKEGRSLFAASHSRECLNKCLENTLRWDEKLYLFLFSREFNRAVEHMLNKPAFLDFIKKPNKEHFDKLDMHNWDIEVKSVLEASFPVNILSPMSSVENQFARKWILSLDRISLAKYISLAMVYAPPSETVVNFLKQNEIDVAGLVLHFQAAHAMFTGVETSGQGINLLREGLSIFGLSDKNHPITSTLIKTLASQSGYSEETVSCIFEKGISIAPNDVKKCLHQTLTIKEKLGIVASSQLANIGIENIVLNPEFREFVDKAASSSLTKKILGKKMEKEDILELFFPSQASGVIRNAKNFLGRYFFAKSVEKGMLPFLFKDLFLGLQYNLNSEVLDKFLEEKHLTKEALVVKIANWLMIDESLLASFLPH